MHAGVCSLRGSTSSMAKVARWTLIYYAATTLTAVVLGIVLVNVLNPGRGSPLNGDGVSDCAVDQVQPCEGLGKSAFAYQPRNVQLWVLFGTISRPASHQYNVTHMMQENNNASWTSSGTQCHAAKCVHDMIGQLLLQAAAPSAAEIPAAVQRTPLEALLDVARNMFPDNVAAAAVNMNILGVITFSLFFGLCLSTVGDAAEPMIKLVDVSTHAYTHCVAITGFAHQLLQPLAVVLAPGAVLCCAVLCCAVLCCAVLCCAVNHNQVQVCTSVRSTKL